MSLSIVDLCITCYKISPDIWLSYFCYEVLTFQCYEFPTFKISGGFILMNVLEGIEVLAPSVYQSYIYFIIISDKIFRYLDFFFSASIPCIVNVFFTCLLFLLFCSQVYWQVNVSLMITVVISEVLRNTLSVYEVAMSLETSKNYLLLTPK